MSRQTPPAAVDDMLPEYDFSRGVRGKHYEAYRAGTNVVFLDADLIQAFPDSALVNRALRLLVRLAQTEAITGPRRSKKVRSTTSKRRSRTQGRST